MAGRLPSARRGRPAVRRLLLFGAGDYGFNLYWQALMLHLLFFYTDRLGLPPATAGAVMIAGGVADGIADLAIGIAADRRQLSYRRLLAWGCVPLGIVFPLLFVDPGGLAGVIGIHLIFRILYALVNLPYAAWTTRVSAASADRTLIAGARMAFGAAGAVTVAFAMPGLAGGYPGTAGLFAAIATALLVATVLAVPEQRPPAAAGRRPLAQDFLALGRNGAFVTLAAAGLATTVAGAIIGHSVLFYFTHYLGDRAAGGQAIAAMAIAAAAAIPLWTAVALRIGGRATWLVAAAGAGAALLAFAAWPVPRAVGAALVFLALIQAGLSGLNLAAWALLPASVDVGAVRSGIRVEATAFSVFILVQKLGLGAAGLLLGLAYQHWGYEAGRPDEAAQAGIRWLMLVGPLAALAAGAAAMRLNPLRRSVERAAAGQSSSNVPDTPSA